MVGLLLILTEFDGVFQALCVVLMYLATATKGLMMTRAELSDEIALELCARTRLPVGVNEEPGTTPQARRMFWRPGIGPYYHDVAVRDLWLRVSYVFINANMNLREPFARPASYGMTPASCWVPSGYSETCSPQYPSKYGAVSKAGFLRMTKLVKRSFMSGTSPEAKFRDKPTESIK